MKNRKQSRDFLDAVMDGFCAVADKWGVAVDDFCMGRRMRLAFIRVGNLKVRVIFDRDNLEYRLGSLAAPNIIEDKFDGSRVWFFPESVRDYLRGRVPVCEEEVFQKIAPASPSQSMAEFRQLILSLGDELQDLFDPESFPIKRKALEDYENERAAQISAIARRRYPVFLPVSRKNSIRDGSGDKTEE